MYRMYYLYVRNLIFHPSKMAVRYSSSYESFKQCLDSAKNIVVLTGAGVSAESGIPTFRGSTSSLWRTHSPAELATPTAFKRNPALVWEFYHYRREVAFKSEPNNVSCQIMEIRVMQCLINCRPIKL